MNILKDMRFNINMVISTISNTNDIWGGSKFCQFLIFLNVLLITVYTKNLAKFASNRFFKFSLIVNSGDR